MHQLKSFLTYEISLWLTELEYDAHLLLNCLYDSHVGNCVLISKVLIESYIRTEFSVGIIAYMLRFLYYI